MKTSNKILTVYIAAAFILPFASLMTNLRERDRVEPQAKLFLQKLADTEIHVIELDDNASVSTEKNDKKFLRLNYAPTPDEIRGDTLLVSKGLFSISAVLLPHIENVIKAGKTIPLSEKGTEY